MKLGIVSNTGEAVCCLCAAKFVNESGLLVHLQMQPPIGHSRSAMLMSREEKKSGNVYILGPKWRNDLC